MAGNLNKVSLIGNVGQDIKIKQNNTGEKIAIFSLATTEKWKDKQGEVQSRTQWHKIVVFNNALAKFVENYVKKGSKLYVEGQLQTRKWQDNDGVDRYVTEVVLQKYHGEIQLLDSKPRQEERKTPKSYEHEGNARGYTAPF
ncbi:single-stranded DNA-binding protein [Bartonella sp. TP]|uniref:single-stranded DNA-binding protein n=1 Tax=Bartonella sp. TP TaxID=3057550 RepID=UPI0025AF280E|nr:single-stranded DNA-binding protein [Bartonella sp. TP]WJW79987.1 single-stranded DNA-binding protein [Bartonella sp. TP]